MNKTKLCNSEATRQRSVQPSLRSHLLDPADSLTRGATPSDDGWRAAGNERRYQAALSSSSRSRRARFLSNCIGFSNFLFQDEWMEIPRGGGGGGVQRRGGLLSATLGWLLLMIRLVFRACPNTCLVITLRSAAASPSCWTVLMQPSVILCSFNKHRPQILESLVKWALSLKLFTPEWKTD